MKRWIKGIVLFASAIGLIWFSRVSTTIISPTEFGGLSVVIATIAFLAGLVMLISSLGWLFIYVTDFD